MIINHNLGAMNAQRQMSTNQNNMGDSMEKLSSGLRINRAGDDAAGLAISEKMRGQIRGLEQADRNAQDGISLLQTAEGALDETHSILQRMRELAVQAGNDTNNTGDRDEIQNEINQLTEEIDRIGNNTEFNTKNLLNGNAGFSATVESSSGLTAVAGGNAGTGTITVSGVTAAKQAEISYTDDDGTSDAVTVQAGTFQINGKDITVESGSETFDDLVSAINDKTSETGVTATGTATDGLVLKHNSIGASAQINVENIGNVVGASVGSLEVTDNNTATTTATSSSDSFDGVDASITSASLGSGEFAVSGNNVTVVGGTFDGAKFKVDENVNGGSGDIEIESNNSIGLLIGANEGQDMSVSINDMRADALGVGSVSVGSKDDAEESITKIQNAIETVSSERSKLGANQNRLEHTINNLGTSAENLQAAESRIRDVDMAKEMMEMTKNNILSQASQSMLAQANQQPQSVLQLLQ